jgi:hypothetical protein
VRLAITLFALVAGFSAAPLSAQTAGDAVSVIGRIVEEGDRHLVRPAIAFISESDTLRASVATDGRFFASLPQGRYRVTVSNLPAGYQLRMITAGPLDISGQPLEVTGEPADEVLIRLAYAGRALQRVSGRVLGVDQDKWQNMKIRLVGAPNVSALEVSVLPRGTFEFPDVLPGTYRLQVSMADHLRTPPPPMAPVTVTVDGADLTGVELRALPTVAVNITIAVDGDRPVPTIALHFVGNGTVVSAHNIGETSGTLSAELLPGDYTVTASGLSKGYTITVLNDGAVDLRTGKLHVDASRSVSVRVETRTSLPFRTIDGRVILRDPAVALPDSIQLDRPTTRMIVSVEAPLEFSEPLPRALIRPDGTFTLSDVLPGTYIPFFRPNHLVPQLPFTLGADDRELDLIIPRIVNVAGRLAVVGPLAPLQSYKVVFTRTSPVAGAPDERYEGFSQMDGTFFVNVPEGSGYRVAVTSLRPGYSVSRMTIGAQTIDDTSEVTVAAGIAPMRIVVQAPASPTGHRVKGRVINPLRPDQTGEETLELADPQGRVWLSVNIGADGRFEIPSVAPGLYSVSFYGSYDGEAPRVGGLPRLGDRGAILRVADRDIEDLRIERIASPVRRVTLLVRIIVDDGGPIPPLYVTSSRPGSSNSWLAPGLQVTLAEGEQQLSIQDLAEGFTLQEFRYGDVDLLERPALVTQGSTELIVRVASPVRRTPRVVSGRIVGVERFDSSMRLVVLANQATTLSVRWRADGSFVFSRVFPGTYHLSVRRMGDDFGPILDAVTLAEVLVAETDVTQLMVVAPYRTSIQTSGTAGVDPEVALPYLVRSDSAGKTVGGSQLDRRILYLRDGDRISAFDLPGGYRVESMTFGSTDLQRDPIRIDTGRLPPIRVLIGRAPPDPDVPVFRIAGRVTGNRPVGFVRLTFDDGQMLRARVRADRTFLFDRVPPGRHQLEAESAWIRSRVAVSDRDVNDVVLAGNR